MMNRRSDVLLRLLMSQPCDIPDFNVSTEISPIVERAGWTRFGPTEACIWHNHGEAFICISTSELPPIYTALVTRPNQAPRNSIVYGEYKVKPRVRRVYRVTVESGFSHNGSGPGYDTLNVTAQTNTGQVYSFKLANQNQQLAGMSYTDRSDYMAPHNMRIRTPTGMDTHDGWATSVFLDSDVHTKTRTAVDHFIRTDFAPLSQDGHHSDLETIITWMSPLLYSLKFSGLYRNPDSLCTIEMDTRIIEFDTGCKICAIRKNIRNVQRLQLVFSNTIMVEFFSRLNVQWGYWLDGAEDDGVTCTCVCTPRPPHIDVAPTCEDPESDGDDPSPPIGNDTLKIKIPK